MDNQPSWQHVALVARSEDAALRFFQKLLGLEILRTKVVAADLARELLGPDRDIQVIEFGNGNLRFEVFIYPEATPDRPRIDHVCLLVPDRDGLMARAAEMGYRSRQAWRGGNRIDFLLDQEGQLFEIK